MYIRELKVLFSQATCACKSSKHSIFQGFCAFKSLQSPNFALRVVTLLLRTPPPPTHPPPPPASRFRVVFQSISSRTGPLSWVSMFWSSVRTNRWVGESFSPFQSLVGHMYKGWRAHQQQSGTPHVRECPSLDEGRRPQIRAILRERPVLLRGAVWLHSCQSRWSKLWKRKAK